MKILSTLLITLILLTFSASAHAQSDYAGPDLVSVGVGIFDVDSNNRKAGEARLEYRWGKPLLWRLKPWAGLEVNLDGAKYAAAGLLADFKIGKGFLITPSFGAGLYAQGGGKDLGSVVEFRSQLEMGWEFKNLSRIGVVGGHISNASLSDRNPGMEFLGLYYHMPVDWLK